MHIARNTELNIPHPSLLSNDITQILLSTVQIYIYDIHNKPVKCRAFLDSGSQSNFITSSLFKKLNLKAENINAPVSGINQKNPSPEYPHFAVAESGEKPLIIIYVWPTLDIVCLLKEGASKIYANLDYSPDGELLVSQSGEPDYLITVWNWHENTILLRTKSYVHDVFRVKFSPYVPGEITTCGLSHIKFWKMATTFTGLKLQGELGRFGKTEYSDIYGVLPMPDEKVVSGCDWGNILVWDEGLITLEVFRTLRKTCHDGPIMQFFYNEGELWSVSLDGHVKIWWYEKIDQADPPDDDRVILLDPSCDFYIPGAMLYCIEKQYARQVDNTWYFAQDGNGGIWMTDLTTDDDPEPSNQIYKCHAGQVVDIAASPFGTYLLSLGRDGRLYVYNYLTKKLIWNYEFPAKGACMLWLPTELVRTGDIIIAGFEDGQLRVFCIYLNEKEISLTVIQIIKPHSKSVTGISINPAHRVLVSTSEDKTMFIFKLDTTILKNLLEPIGFIPTPDVVTCITWHPIEENEVLVGCRHGKMMQVEVPTMPQEYTEVSFLLDLKPIYKNFVTYKAQIRRNIKLKEIEERKEKKRDVKRKELEKIKKENPGLELDEEIFLADSESEEELEPLFIPEVPNHILWLKYTEDMTIWVSMAGYDSGYMYEYMIDQKDDIPYKFTMIADADDIEISSYVYTFKEDYVIFAMQDGSIRVNKVSKADFRDFSDYWTLAMHDNRDGFVPKMCFSSDEKYFFSCGYDGNIFSYIFRPEGYKYKLQPGKVLRMEKEFESVQDVDGYKKMSMEETKIKAEQDRVQKVANERKAQVREMLKVLRDRYQKLLTRNSRLLPSQVIPQEELELDQRVTKHVDNELESKLALVKRKLAYDLEKSEVQMKKLKKYLTDPCDLHPLVVHGINKPELFIMTVRQRTLPQLFYDTLEKVQQMLTAECFKGRPTQRTALQSKVVSVPKDQTQPLEYFLLSLSPNQIENTLGPKLQRLLRRYRTRRDKWERRQAQWNVFNAKRPVTGKNHPDDEILLSLTTKTIGDYRLKESPDYKPSPEERDSTMKKYYEVLQARLKQFNLRHTFIQKVWDLRDEKYEIRNKLIEMSEKLNAITNELPTELRKYGPPIPDVNSTEFPEEKLIPKIEIPTEEEEELEVLVQVPVENIVLEPTRDEEEQELFINVAEFPPMQTGFFYNPFTDVSKICEYDLEELTEYADHPATPYEISLRSKRLNRLLFEQTILIKEMESLIEYFHDKIRDIQTKRLPIHVGGNFVDIFIITLIQELNVLKKYEDGEDNLMSKVNAHEKLVHELQDSIDVLEVEKEAQEAEIESFSLQELKIQDKFKHATENNKFYDFLKKVFRKKYKPPKIHTDDESSSESSTSSSSEESEEEDTASIDSRDFGFIKQDLNVCPKGCEQAIFDLTVNLRSERHEIEIKTIEKQRSLDLVRKGIEVAVRKMKTLQAHLTESQAELEAYQKEKQRCLNQVNCTVVLNLSQIIDFTPETSEISDFVVFSKRALTELYKRVGVLEREDFEHKQKFETYYNHLTRMKKDMMYMKVKIRKLKNEMIRQMHEKFGRVVNLNDLELALLKKSVAKTYINELEEVVLKKLVCELRLKLTDFKPEFAKMYQYLDKRIRKAQEESSKAIKDNTLKLELLEVITREKKELVKLVFAQPKKKELLEKTQQSIQLFHKDIEKLESVIQHQQAQLQELKNEIKMLKTKGLPPTPIRERVAVEAVKKSSRESKESESKKWSDYDLYIEGEGEEIAEEKHLIQDIDIPGFYSRESEDLIRNLLDNVLFQVEEKRKNGEVEHIVKSILMGIIKCDDSTAIAKEIIKNIPNDLTNDQLNLVESAAKKLHKMQGPEGSEENFSPFMREFLEEILKETLTKVDKSPEEMVADILRSVMESVPLVYLMQSESIDMVAERISQKLGSSEFDTEKIIESVGQRGSLCNEEILEVLATILEKVFERRSVSTD